MVRDGVSLKTPRPRGWVGAGRPSGCKSSFNKRNMYQYPHVSQLFILLPWQSRVYPEPLKVVEFVQLTTECCWGQPSDPCQRGCLTSHACVMWGPRTLNADDDDDDDQPEKSRKIGFLTNFWRSEVHIPNIYPTYKGSNLFSFFKNFLRFLIRVKPKWLDRFRHAICQLMPFG